MYNREQALKILQEKYGYKPYGEKHEENIFTAWFQNYYLPSKFGIDKRKAHFSSLICSGQMMREEALKTLSEPPVYPIIGWEEKIWQYPNKTYWDYPNSYRVRKFASWCYKIWKLLKVKPILKRI